MPLIAALDGSGLRAAQVQTLDNVKQFATYGNSLNSVHAARLPSGNRPTISRAVCAPAVTADRTRIAVQPQCPGHDCPSVKDTLPRF